MSLRFEQEKLEKQLSSELPDVAKNTLSRDHDELNLQRVGMEKVEIPIKLPGSKGTQISVPALADFYVSLDKSNVRGIHMSRLFLSAQQVLDQDTFGPATIEKLLRSFVESHKNISKKSFARFQYKHLVKKKALKSDNTGWMSYPVVISAELTQSGVAWEVAVDVAYSSTCPCSASLARQLIQSNFKHSFSDDLVEAEKVEAWLGTQEAISATPHSQRSYAEVKVRMKDCPDDFGINDVIEAVESALSTPVQGPVKREDEQEFARLNGTNPMFCEDAARRVKIAMEQDSRATDYYIHVRHLESLHPFDASAVAVKGVPGGYRD